jgi:tetratricopeptide (TPR) repeat protein
MTLSRKLFLALAAFSLGLAPMARAGEAPGAYLAALHAASANDFAKAAEYFSRALAADPDNTTLMEEAMNGYVGAGRFDAALPLAQRQLATGAANQTAAIVEVEELARTGDYQALIDRQAAGKLKIAPLVDGLVTAWAQIGAGRMSDATASFDKLIAAPATMAFGLYHKALALALAGDYEAADKILSGKDNPSLNLTRRGIVARAEILSQLERDGDASQLLTDTFGADLDPALVQLKARLDQGQTLPLTVVTSANDGMAEVFYTVAMALNGDAPDSFVLTFARAAEALEPGHLDALLLSAGLLEKLERYDLAIATYERIPAGSDYFHIAELGRAEALERQDKPDEAIAVLKRLSETHDRIAAVFVTLGDALRKQERYAEAEKAYDRAIALYGAPTESQWSVYFSRGISEERQQDWAKAEPDFRQALKLRPNQPQVLNYLGYSYVEKKQNLDEALDMIQRAVKARPDDAYITDSLGWVYYRLGRYGDAVRQMERAVALMPVDPVINDHLGDVYWAVGRKREAEFQWQRALSFKPDDKDAARIRRKLDLGLDQVLQDEGAAPLAVA